MIATVLQWHWWTQAVGPNIIAAVVCAVPSLAVGFLTGRKAWRGLHRKLDALHARHDQHAQSLQELHRKLDAQPMGES